MALLHVNLHSKALNMDTSISVIMPEEVYGIGLESSATIADEIPVMWLLHGRSDDHTTWMRRTSIERYVSPLGIMVVMPEVSYSRYMDMAHGPAYYTFITKELPEFCKRMFPRMSTKREDNIIAGLSMGGGGAVWAGLNNPTQYGTVGLFSTGGLVPLEVLWRTDMQEKAYVKTNIDIFGIGNTTTLKDTEFDYLKLIRDTAKNNKILPRVYHACGTEDERHNVAIIVKEEFEAMEGNPYNYEYHEGPGIHEWIFWDEWILKFLKSYKDNLKGCD